MSFRYAYPLLLLLLCSASSVSADWTSTYDQKIGDIYYYIFFANGDSELPIDGPSGVGTICNPAVIGAASGTESITYSDMCRAGSAIRTIDESGIRTISGSLNQVGFVDGPADVARYGGHSSGENMNNGLTKFGEYYYLADTTNNAIRKVSTDGTCTTYVDKTITPDGGRPLNRPQFVAGYNMDDDSHLYIADTDNQRILSSVVLGGTPVLSIELSGLMPGPIVISQAQATMYYVQYMSNGYRRLGATHLSTKQQRFIGDETKLGYVSSLILSDDESELLYYGHNDGAFGVFSISTSATPADGPTLKFPWPYTSPTNSVPMLVKRSDPNSWFIVTQQGAYVVSAGPITTLPPLNIRYHGIAAFPRSALPTTDVCLMSQLYFWMRKDVAIAFDTEDYYTQFMPLDDEDMQVMGDVNVSSWCGNITAGRSTDGTIEIVDFWGPTALNLYWTQKAITDSPWYWTRLFLQRLRDEDGWDLGPFCFFNCTTACADMTASKEMCVDYVTPPACNDVCKGAIASGVIMGITLIVLVVLTAISPSCFMNAIIAVPII